MIMDISSSYDVYFTEVYQFDLSLGQSHMYETIFQVDYMRFALQMIDYFF